VRSQADRLPALEWWKDHRTKGDAMKKVLFRFLTLGMALALPAGLLAQTSTSSASQDKPVSAASHTTKAHGKKHRKGKKTEEKKAEEKAPEKKN
jgi:hypothetical protein